MSIHERIHRPWEIEMGAVADAEEVPLLTRYEYVPHPVWSAFTGAVGGAFGSLSMVAVAQWVARRTGSPHDFFLLANEAASRLVGAHPARAFGPVVRRWHRRGDWYDHGFSCAARRSVSGAVLVFHVDRAVPVDVHRRLRPAMGRAVDHRAGMAADARRIAQLCRVHGARVAGTPPACEAQRFGSELKRTANSLRNIVAIYSESPRLLLFALRRWKCRRATPALAAARAMFPP